MLPKVNQTLFFNINSIDEDEAKQEYRSRVSDILEQAIAMEVPINQNTGKIKRLYAGDELSAYFLTEKGVKNYFTTSVIGFREDTIRLVLVKKPDPASITEVQRRSFVRVPAELEIALKINEQIQFVSVTEDVGGGGISIYCEQSVPIHTNDRVGCWLLIPNKHGSPDHVPFKGEVVRIKELENGKQFVMMRFSEIADRDRQKIIRFCFERQLEIRK